MRRIRMILLPLLPVILMFVAGCGSSSGGDAFNPVATKAENLPFKNISAVSGKVAISLITDQTKIDANGGQVLATASIADSNGEPLAGRAVTFSVVAGPASIDPNFVTVTTDSSGKAFSLLIPGETLTTTNVFLKATTPVEGQTATAYASVQIVRGTGVITFITTKPPTDPDGTLHTLEETFSPALASKPFTMMQELPFQVTDSQGNPRVGVPVTLSIDNQLTGKAAVQINKETVITDSNGKGIFNVGVTMTTPELGSFTADSIIYKAATTEASAASQLITYAGFVIAYATKEPEPLSASPETLAFSATDTADATLSFTLTGGSLPHSYTVSSSNPARVTATVSGSKVTVTLVDDSLWTGKVTITVTDTWEETATVSVSRQ